LQTSCWGMTTARSVRKCNHVPHMCSVLHFLALLGAAQSRYALICEKCFSHNGLVKESMWEDARRCHMRPCRSILICLLSFPFQSTYALNAATSTPLPRLKGPAAPLPLGSQFLLGLPTQHSTPSPQLPTRQSPHLRTSQPPNRWKSIHLKLGGGPSRSFVI
jgi:hypothetical protein